jgi:hypothetical protein
MSLAPILVYTWTLLKHKLHEYVYNREVELRLLDLTAVRQKYGKTMPGYLKWFRETRNRCYNLTIGEKDLAYLTFVGLSSYLREKDGGLGLYRCEPSSTTGSNT